MTDNNAIEMKEMGKGNKSILKMELEALPSWDPAKTKGKLGLGTQLRESLKNGKGEEVLTNTKKQKNHTKQTLKV